MAKEILDRRWGWGGGGVVRLVGGVEEEGLEILWFMHKPSASSRKSGELSGKGPASSGLIDWVYMKRGCRGVCRGVCTAARFHTYEERVLRSVPSSQIPHVKFIHFHVSLSNPRLRTAFMLQTPHNIQPSFHVVKLM